MRIYHAQLRSYEPLQSKQRHKLRVQRHRACGDGQASFRHWREEGKETE